METVNCSIGKQTANPRKNGSDKLDYAYQQPSRLLRIDKTFFVPLDLPTSVEKDEVVKALLAQLRDVAGLLSAHEKKHGPSAFMCKK